MDKVVQQVAANAEESASSSEEMRVQAKHMKGFVKDLVIMVSGNIHKKSIDQRTVGEKSDRETSSSRRDQDLGSHCQTSPDFDGSGFVFSHQEQTLYLNILVGRGGYFGFNERGSRGN